MLPDNFVKLDTKDLTGTICIPLNTKGDIFLLEVILMQRDGYKLKWKVDALKP